ncbi:MAG: linear amide C-N hydrolase [Candidatus Aminicenantes bacterium]|nr:linear amide C-N hydrolase [Candidatus Aminicenantes bacterium]
MRLIKNSQQITQLILAALLLTIVQYESFACTSFVLKGGGRQYLAKNLDWHCGQGYLIYNPKSVIKYSFSHKENNISWISKYISITFNQFGVGFPLGGMNTAGLIIESLNAPGSGGVHKDQAILNEFQWIQYQLDNHSDVAGVINNIKTIGVKPLIQNLHYIIMDIQGNVAIIEIINGEFKIYSGDDVRHSVLSNNLYGNSLKYLKNFIGFGGELPLAESRDSQTRFVTIADKLKRHSDKVPDKEAAFQLLSEVSQIDTQWSIVYDNKESRIFFKNARSGKEVQFTFEPGGNSQERYYQYSDLSNCTKGENFKEELTPEINMQLFYRIEESYRRAGISELKLRILKDMFIFGNENMKREKKQLSHFQVPIAFMHSR